MSTFDDSSVMMDNKVSEGSNNSNQNERGAGDGSDEEDDGTNNLLRVDEINSSREVFNKYRNSKLGRMTLWDLRKALKELEIQPAEDELFKIIEVIQEGEENLLQTGTIDFDQFITIVGNQKKQDRPIHDNETLSAFVAMGGNSDRTGAIQTDKLTKACQEFGLTIDIDALIREVDDDGNGTVDFDEFTMMMSANKYGEEDDDYHDRDIEFYEKGLRGLDDNGNEEGGEDGEGEGGETENEALD